MPIYTYRCRQCGLPVECVVSYADRDKPMQHEGSNELERTDPAYRERCGGGLEREEGLESPTIGKPAFQSAAVLGNGDHLKGHFGKEAPRRKR